MKKRVVICIVLLCMSSVLHGQGLKVMFSISGGMSGFVSDDLDLDQTDTRLAPVINPGLELSIGRLYLKAGLSRAVYTAYIDQFNYEKFSNGVRDEFWLMEDVELDPQVSQAHFRLGLNMSRATLYLGFINQRLEIDEKVEHRNVPFDQERYQYVWDQAVDTTAGYRRSSINGFFGVGLVTSFRLGESGFVFRPGFTFYTFGDDAGIIRMQGSFSYPAGKHVNFVAAGGCDLQIRDMATIKSSRWSVTAGTEIILASHKKKKRPSVFEELLGE